MKRNRQLWWFVAPSLFIFLLVGGCVTKGRFEAQLAETQSLSGRLQDQTRKRAELEEEIAKLKRRLGVTESDLAETKKSAADQEAALNNRITVLEEQLALAKDMGSKTEKELKGKMIQMKGEFERDLQKRNQEISTLEARLADQTQESLKFQDRLVDREQEIAELQNSLNEQFSKISKLEEELAKMTEIVDRVRDRFQITQEDAARRERELRESDEARAALVDRLQKEITEGSIKISQMKDRLTIEIVDKILFASGSDRITKNGKEVLKKVSVVLKEVKENDIRIEGHTDNVPIGPKIIDKFPTNWELSTSRATQVVRYLIDQKVDPNNLIAMGLSKFRPVAPNDSDEGKQRNRRIEVILFPRDIQKIARAADH
ncbi:MAG: OmpA family protein [Nitrospiria bacterium]